MCYKLQTFVWVVGYVILPRAFSVLPCGSRIDYINHVATIFSNHKNNACLPRGLAMTISVFVNSMELFEWISVIKSATHMYVTPIPIFTLCLQFYRYSTWWPRWPLSRPMGHALARGTKTLVKFKHLGI